jgi:hypothetical protein
MCSSRNRVGGIVRNLIFTVLSREIHHHGQSQIAMRVSASPRQIMKFFALASANFRRLAIELP